MSGGYGGYLQTSTQNDYGRRPWNTALYTGFENYAFLKQPQNAIVREDPSFRPEIYRPPEMSGLGAHHTIVSGSGRVLARRRRPGMRGLGAMLMDGGLIAARPFIDMPPPAIELLPPSIVPPVPQPVAAGPQVCFAGSCQPIGTVYALPGNATTPGSPFAPPVSLPPSSPTPAGAIAAATPPPVSSLFGPLSDWFNSATWFAGVPNGYIAIGIAGAIFLFAGKRR